MCVRIMLLFVKFHICIYICVCVLSCSACFEILVDVPSGQGCDRVACDKYWETGCTALHGKLGKIKDWQMVQIPAQCLNRNVVEKEILQEYMQSKNLSAQDVWRACVAKLEAAEFTCGA